MEREIKFRGIRVDNSEWIFGSLIESKVCGNYHYHIQQSEKAGPSYCFAIHPETIGQFTGLKDKNGVDIYEGDILKVPDDYDTYGFMAGEEREVVFLDGGFRFKSKIKSHRGHWLEDTGEFEIIGNIHNPHKKP